MKMSVATDNLSNAMEAYKRLSEHTSFGWRFDYMKSGSICDSSDQNRTPAPYLEKAMLRYMPQIIAEARLLAKNDIDDYLAEVDVAAKELTKDFK